MRSVKQPKETIGSFISASEMPVCAGFIVLGDSGSVARLSNNIASMAGITVIDYQMTSEPAFRLIRRHGGDRDR